MFFEKIEAMYRDSVYKRADANGAIFYFSAKDFEGLHSEPFVFSSVKGHSLKGNFYYYDGYVPGRIVIFDHGMGSGHRGYMKEIELIAREGYLVFAYDHTGCMESGGETTGGFAQSLVDLNDAVCAVKSIAELKGCDISVVGHSWGAFSTMNICALHPDISHVAAMSGFIAVECIVNQSFGGLLSLFRKKIYAIEQASNPEFVRYNAVKSLGEYNGKALIIHSEDDNVCSCKFNFDVLRKELFGKRNISFLKVNGKNHNPNYTEDAVKYKDEFFEIYKKELKADKLNSENKKKAFILRFDWDRMTAQDMSVWQEIFDFLKS